MNKYLYFDEESEHLILFENDEIKEETFREDILRIAAKVNGIMAKELFEKLSDSQIDNLLIALEYDSINVVNNFYKCIDDETDYYLTIKQSLIEKVKIIAKNSNRTIMQFSENKKGIFMASNNYIEKNLIKGN